ncbi:acetyltransferase [Desulforamulus aeronauticus]|uniref:Sugar O-acyltransferase, sialic acid O-acetyltransferase NeuD family n=1 Tax=Desulforamulus aeronauticus DSM 10349 TaxID=1121421 RepID=A0A1M6V473_9FIRM|nr:acetyltransferase [Desulforamulus aeronauticus]SHK76302.1 sugar O-acyltransferase, sialic acid O-acetyltransferase NeuD family [Desulforamulus aeronauticus DSM 10349]
MKDLIIVGGGGMARKVLVTLKKMNKSEPKWNIKGFIDDNVHVLDNVKCDYGIIGSIVDWQPKDKEVFVMGISSPAVKEKVARILKDKGARFETIISPEVLLGDFVTFGEGCVVMTPFVIDCGATFGNFVTVLGSTVSFDAKIGDFTTTAGFANTTTANLGKRVYVGSHAVILEGLTVGDDAYISVGSIVLNDVPAGVQVFGYPARIFRDNNVKGSTK